ncbi:MAG: lysophospholipid acyltransferase family protein [Pseudomonadota bacterium]
MRLRLDGVARWLRQSASGRWLSSIVGAFYMRLVNWTTRWSIEGRENYDRALTGETGVIAVGWHGRLFMSVFWVPRGRQRRYTVAMISNNRDGDLISALVARFGVVAVRGSTYDREKRRDKGGVEAFVGAEAALRDRKALIAITPDGPRGPRMRAQHGAARLSIVTRAPVQPITFSARKAKVLHNWDRFMVPWPFGSGLQIYGETLNPPDRDDDATVAAYALQIEEELNRITALADRRCGQAEVPPDPAPGTG